MPTPSRKRPFSSTALVAAACAMIAGWIRMVGQVTAVVTGSEHTCAMAPIIDQTNGLWPCSSFHGWKWSEIHSASKPASLGQPRLLDESRRGVLLAGQEVADSSCRAECPATSALKRRRTPVRNWRCCRDSLATRRPRAQRPARRRSFCETACATPSWTEHAGRRARSRPSSRRRGCSPTHAAPPPGPANSSSSSGAEHGLVVRGQDGVLAAAQQQRDDPQSPCPVVRAAQQLAEPNSAIGEPAGQRRRLVAVELDLPQRRQRPAAVAQQQPDERRPPMRRPAAGISCRNRHSSRGAQLRVDLVRDHLGGHQQRVHSHGRRTAARWSAGSAGRRGTARD